MGDSDDEYDRKRRDKFRGERTESVRGSENRRDERRIRDDWNDRESWGTRNRGRGDYRGPMRDRYSPGAQRDLSPPVKRMRPDWEDRRIGYDPPGYGYSAPWDPPGHHMPPVTRTIPMRDPGAHAVGHAAPLVDQSSGDTQPPMMSLKAFLLTQDDNITDEEALSKYNEYKLQFKRNQLNEFFVAHKDEEWFKIKYHPDDSVKRKEEQNIAIKKRLDVFKEFLSKSKIDGIVIDADNPDPLVHLLDSIVIKLEGGTDFDLTVLDPVKLQKTKEETDISNEQIKITETVGNSDGEVDSDKEDVVEKEKSDVSNNDSKNENGQKSEVMDITNDNDHSNVVKPLALHRTTSVFLRNLAPTITKFELETICKRFQGFMRLSIADPLPERRWFRRGWVTFDRDVNIKEICWNLNNVRLRDCELGAIVNRDLSKRIRSVNGITSHRQVARNDMKLCANIINNFDKRADIWQTNNEETPAECTYGVVSHNPVLQNITDFLIEEASAEEEELLGENATCEPEDTTDKDVQLFKALDKMLLYLRIVHSVDYYNHSEYINEDEMPNRCGIMHARCALPSSPPTQQEINDYCQNFQTKVSSLTSSTPNEISEKELIQLGAKSEEEEIEKFVTANTQEISKDKWLCPLSGKKFKGPDFVRKHIFNKHIDKLDDVKKEVKYFNNYLRDPKRPQLPEHPGNKQPRKELSDTPQPYTPAANPYQLPGYPPYGGGGFGRGMYGYTRPPARGGFRGGRGGFDYRPIIHYRDLDAPKEPEENFI
ncbi:serrate RNA effector molecule homolog isoform X2 [Daktulosphaira vitifoliae]|uniref:serrate RNA effector molecule homolog isoform X2 n=1 Tax=Daktulosphaira vitifoliae TaxID=58002 RepID=UPI0021AAC132|nr:serrate RNA effector molecule homolog isoform X2 [Daktulosphaira vitifoliae]